LKRSSAAEQFAEKVQSVTAGAEALNQNKGLIAAVNRPKAEFFSKV
jgi:hypothetical protein